MPETHLTLDQIRRAPKVLLHDHLDGGLRPATVIELADAVQQEFRPGDVMVSYGTYEDASTLNFYVRQPIHVVNSRTEGDMYYGSLFPDAPAIFDDDASLAALWKGPRRVFLWVEEDKVPAYIRQSSSFQLARSGGKLILMNRAWALQPAAK